MQQGRCKLAVLCSLASFSFTIQQNYVAEVEAWTLYIAYVFALAAKWGLSPKLWKPQIEIALKHIHNLLESLGEEAIAEGPRIDEGGLTDKPFTDVRLTVIAGFLSVLDAWPREDATSYDLGRVRAFCAQYRTRLKIWSEAAIPYHLAVFWLIRRNDPRGGIDFFLRELISFLVHSNRPDTASPLASPYYDLNDILPHLIGLSDDPIEEAFRGRSFMLEGLIHLYVRRNWKQTMKRLWPEVTRIAFASFTPEMLHEFFTWQCSQGINRSVYPRHTKAWEDLTNEATEDQGLDIPSEARAYPHFVLLYLLVCPHRTSSSAVRWLDSALAIRRQRV